jgi:hypothetical protein
MGAFRDWRNGTPYLGGRILLRYPQVQPVPFSDATERMGSERVTALGFRDRVCTMRRCCT